MPDNPNSFVVKLHQILDMLLLVFSFSGAYYLKRHYLPEDYSGLSTEPNYYFVLLLILVLCFASFNLFGFYKPYRTKIFDQILSSLLRGLLCGYAFVILILYLSKGSDISRLLLGIAFLLSNISLLCSKAFIYYFQFRHRNKDQHQKKILIIGSKKRARELIRTVLENQSMGFKIVGCLEIDESEVGRKVRNSVTILGSMEKYKEILNEQAIDEVVFAIPLYLIKNVKEYIAYGEDIGVNIRILPNWQLQQLMYSPETASIRFESFIGMATLVLSSTPKQGTALTIKSFLDYTIALTCLLILSPLLLSIALMVKLTSKGTIFFRQERSGLCGRKFFVLKFRTMVAEAEKIQESLLAANEVDGPVFKIKNDPRITWVGKILRKTSLDELPQLINIIKGEMSLVGPRPPIPAEVKQYEDRQRRRLSMKPGLTCIWQVSGRNNIDFKTWMDMDLEYIDNWSLWLDFKLLFLTIPAVVLGTGH